MSTVDIGCIVCGGSISALKPDPDCAECEKPEQWEKLHEKLARVTAERDRLERVRQIRIEENSDLLKEIYQAKDTMREVAGELRRRAEKLESFVEQQLEFADPPLWRTIVHGIGQLSELADRLDKE
jgi:hypothetical protein